MKRLLDCAQPALVFAIAALMALVSISPALAANNPIPGVDVVVKKKPSGNAFRLGQVDKDGRFSAAVALPPGEYTLQVSCRTEPCPNIRGVTLSVEGRAIPLGDPQSSFTVSGARAAQIDGQLQWGDQSRGKAINWSYTNGGVTHEDTWDQQRSATGSKVGGDEFRVEGHIGK